MYHISIPALAWLYWFPEAAGPVNETIVY